MTISLKTCREINILTIYVFKMAAPGVKNDKLSYILN